MPLRGRPGPVLVDITKDVFQGQAHYTPVTEIHLPGYKVHGEGHAGQIRRAAQMIWEAERPFLYAGGGIDCRQRERRASQVRRKVGCSCRLHPDGSGRLPGGAPNFISMPGMHGSYAANMGLTHTDLSLR